MASSIEINRRVVVTCAVTGAGDAVGKHPAIPVTPRQIAEAALEAASVGAAVAHIHVRDPETGKASRDPALYREVVDRIRASGSDVIVNLTAGMGGDLLIGPDHEPTRFGSGTDLVGAETRAAHVAELLPEIYTLDCGSLNFGDGSLVYVSTPDILRRQAAIIQRLGVKPELEIFDTGNLWFAKPMLAEGLLDAPPLFQFCLGIPWGLPPEPRMMLALRDMLPAGSVWAGFGIGRMQMPMVAQAILLGGNVRVGLEDNLYLDRSVFGRCIRAELPVQLPAGEIDAGSPVGRRCADQRSRGTCGGAGEGTWRTARFSPARRSRAGLVVSTGILGDLVLPIGAFNPDRVDEAHKLQRSGVGQNFATNPSWQFPA